MPSTLIVANSQPEAGASNISAKKDSFDIEFPAGLSFPSDSNPRICLVEAAIWFNFFNVSEALGNNRFYYTDRAVDLQKYSVTIPDGLYSVDLLNSILSRDFVSRGLPSNLFTIAGDPATNRIRISKVLAPGGPADFGHCLTWSAGTPWKELGQTLDTTTPAGGGPDPDPGSWLSPTRAALNTVESIIVNTSLAAGASYIGGASSKAIANFTVGDAKPGQLIQFRAPFQQWISLPRLRGSQVSRVSFSITDQTGKQGSLDTAGENWVVSLLLEW